MSIGGMSSNSGDRLVVSPANWPNRLSATTSAQFSSAQYGQYPLAT